MSDPQHERRRETLRTHIILTALTTTASFAAVIAASLFVPIVSHFESAGLSEETRAALADHILYLHAGFWPVVAVALVATVVSAVVLFERMAAPLVRMVRMMQSIARGQLPDSIVIRRVDYLQEEARALNAMTEALRARWMSIRENEARLRGAIGAFAERETELPETLRGPLQELVKSEAELQQQLDEIA